jgi:biotin/methionine sulfoxide reductase
VTRTSYTAAHWGVYEVHTPAAGERPLLRPFERDGDPSPIGVDQLDPSVQRLRVARPAVRRSWLRGGPGAAPERRGIDPFVEVEWDTALDLVAAEISRVRERFGNRAIFGGSYGWASAGRFHNAPAQLHRFLNLCGGHVRSVDSYSLGAASALMPYIVTDVDDGNASHTSWSVLADHTRLFVTFGGVPLKNTQVSFSGAGDHRVRAAMRRIVEAGAHVVNVSPVRDNIEPRGSIDWIPIRPNTDTAMLLGLAHAVQADARFDRGFLDRYTVGYDVFARYLTGAVDGVPKTPEWAERITGVPAGRIVRLAGEMLSQRTLINVAWALQRAAHGEQPFWMVVTLAAMLGQIGLPGGGYGLGYGATNALGSEHRRLPGPSLPRGKNAVGDFIPVARIADLLLEPGGTFTYKGVSYSYPDIKLVYWAGGNPFHHHQDLNRLTRAWCRPETVIVHEQYWTAGAKRADIVLPATTSIERNDIGFSTREGFYIAMRRAVDPFGQARDDHQIFAGLAERMGLREAFTEGLSTEQWLARLYRENAQRVGERGVALPPFEDFWEAGYLDLAPHDARHIMHEAFRRDPDANPLRTPSGRIEIFSASIASYGLEDCPGHPVWRQPFEWLGSPAAARHPLHLISDQPSRRLHSQLDHSPYSQSGKIAGREPVYLNTRDAAARGIGSGDLVEIYNERGRCLAGAVVTDDIMPGVVRLATGGWWDSTNGEPDRNGNPNTLTLDRGSSSFSQGCSAQTCLVEARRYEGDPPPVRAYEPPQFVAE